MKTAELLEILKNRFDKNMDRHKGLNWEKIQDRLKKNPAKLKILIKMEETGGEPDVVGIDPETHEILFYDCSPESPKDRRSVCYDPKSLASRKEHKPKDSAVGMAKKIGANLLTEEEYRALQALGSFDLKSSSWLETPAKIRKLGGAIFGDCRYDQVFIYHNGAESYYAVRGFRCSLRV